MDNLEEKYSQGHSVVGVVQYMERGEDEMSVGRMKLLFSNLKPRTFFITLRVIYVRSFSYFLLRRYFAEILEKLIKVFVLTCDELAAEKDVYHKFPKRTESGKIFPVTAVQFEDVGDQQFMSCSFYGRLS